MPSTIAHAVSASWVAVTFAHVQPSETLYLAAALASATALDADHVIYLIRDRARYRRLGYRGRLHQARSVLHELAGLLLMGAVSGILFLTDPKLGRVVFVAFAVHIVQDWLIGKSYPLAPVDFTPVQFFALTFRQKVIVDALLLIVFGGLWISYLAGVR